MKPVIVFASNYPNIGNLLCTYGATEILEESGIPVWQIGDREFPRGLPCTVQTIPPHVARSRAGAVVITAGVLHRNFLPAWRWIAETGLPVVLWGTGACWERYEDSILPSAEFEAVRPLVRFAAVRDRKTAEAYGLDVIGTGPEVPWILRHCHAEGGGGLLYVTHTGNALRHWPLAHASASDNLSLAPVGPGSFHSQLSLYRRADAVITERLHGAYLAASLGLPFAVIPWDAKLSEFVETWGVGRIVRSPSEAEEWITSPKEKSVPWTGADVTPQVIRILREACDNA